MVMWCCSCGPQCDDLLTLTLAGQRLLWGSLRALPRSASVCWRTTGPRQKQLCRGCPPSSCVRIPLSPPGPPLAQQPGGPSECVMCMDATRRTRLRPCCHVLFCEMCAEQARLADLECPMCRCHVQDYEVGDFNSTYVPVI